MATIDVTGTVITIEFNLWERLWTGHARYTVPRSAIRQATVTDEPLRVPRGARRGLTVSGHTKIGVWGLYSGRRQLVSVNRKLPGLHLLVDRAGSDGGAFDVVIVSVPDARQLARTLRAVGL